MEEWYLARRFKYLEPIHDYQQCHKQLGRQSPIKYLRTGVSQELIHEWIQGLIQEWTPWMTFIKKRSTSDPIIMIYDYNFL